MSIKYTTADEIVEVPPGNAVNSSRATSIVKTLHMELIRLVLTAGNETSVHTTPGNIAVQCLEGRVAFNLMGETQELTSGHLLFLPANAPHSINALEDSSLLVTFLTPQNRLPEPFGVAHDSSEVTVHGSGTDSFFQQNQE